MSEGDDTSTEDFWAQLVCVTDTDTPPLMIGKDKYTIGRARGCDICLENNKLVSATHCYILRDGEGKVWLYDNSTNGTLLNTKTKLAKGECREIIHGDEFYIVYKKGEDNLNIGYVFQDLSRLKEEEEQDSENLDQTLEYENDGALQADSTIADDRINIAEEEESPKPAAKRRLDQTEEDVGLGRKRARADIKISQSDSPTVKTTTSNSSSDVSDAATTTVTTSTADNANKDKEEKDETDAARKSVDKGTSVSATTKLDTPPADAAASKKDVGVGEVGGDGKDDVFAETLTCIICQELLHDCISLQPCMHSFCAGCYSKWMAHSSECPSCRTSVDRINKNHIVNNLVEAYIKEHPEKRRPEQDIKELDAKNKITRDMLYPKRRRRDSDDYSDSEDYEDDDDENADSVPAHPLFLPPALAHGLFLPPAPAPHGVVFGFGTPVFGAASNAYRAVCRQCPSSGSAAGTGGLFGKVFNTVKNLVTDSPTTTTPAGSGTDVPTSTGNIATGDNDADQPSTSGAGPSGAGDTVDRDDKVMPTPPAFQCAANQNHVLCQCCLQIFPDRRIECNTNPDLPPQQCIICYRAFCHAYWGCRKVDCSGCLTKFKDMKFGKKVLTGLILDNPYESEILKNYLEAEGLAVQDVLDVCLAKVAKGTYTCPDQARYTMTGETPLCYPCALRNFKALAYQYRFDIPRDKLPAAVTARSDCYWGKNCRTQINKPLHAQRFNHICNQTRTGGL